VFLTMVCHCFVEAVPCRQLATSTASAKQWHTRQENRNARQSCAGRSFLVVAVRKTRSRTLSTGGGAAGAAYFFFAAFFLRTTFRLAFLAGFFFATFLATFLAGFFAAFLAAFLLATSRPPK